MFGAIMALWTWCSTTVGKWVAGGAAIAGALSVIVLSIFTAGENAEARKVDDADVHAAEVSKSVDQKVSADSPDVVRGGLRAWGRR